MTVYLHVFSVEVHLDQGVSYKVPKTAPIKVAVWTGVVLAIIDLREF